MAISLYPDFDIKTEGRISKEFLRRNIVTFEQAAAFIRQLPYGRNADKTELTSVFSDNCGTCSTKHALLKRLADENNFQEIKLFVGLFKMSGENTPEVYATLKRNNLQYIPEAHCYLKYTGRILDYTKQNSKPAYFIGDLIEEAEIMPDQITAYKIDYHKNYLRTWLKKNRQIKLALEDIWKIREQCIRALAGKT